MGRAPNEFFAEYLPHRFRSVHASVGGRTSIGSVTFRVLDVGEWSLRLERGELIVGEVQDADVVLQITVPADDFQPLIADAVEQSREPSGVATRGALRVLELDRETADLIRRVRGSVLFSVEEPDRARRLLMTPGQAPADLANPDCTVACSMADFIDVYSGRQSPMQLFAQGRLRLSGNVQLALALGGVLSQGGR